MRAPRPRPRLAALLAGLAAVWWGLFFFGLTDLVVAPMQDERFHEFYLLETGWGLLFLVLVTVPLVTLAVRPGVTVPVLQLGALSAAVLVGAGLAAYGLQLGVALGLLVTMAVLALLGPTSWRVAWRPDVVVGGLALVAVPAGALFAWAQVDGWRAASADISRMLNHLPMQAALGVAVPLVAGLAAAAVGARLPGWRVPVWTTAVTACWLGAASVVYPDLQGSLGTVFGSVAAGWGVALAAVAEVRARGWGR